MGQKYCTHVLNHREDAWTLKSEIPSWSGHNLSFDTVGNWSNELLCLENFRIFGVNEGDYGEFDYADEDDDDVFLMKVTIDADVNHEPDDLGDHQDETDYEEALLKDRFAWFWGEVVFGLIGFKLDCATLAINIIVEVDGVNFAELNLMKDKLCRNKRPIVNVHESLGFHLCDFVIDSINRRLVATICQYLFILGQVLKRFHIVVVIGTSSSKCSD